MCLFIQARAISLHPYLIVAVQKTEFIRQTKPNANVFYSTDIRKKLISELRCVDKVIEYTEVQDVIKHVDFDIFAVGEDQNHQGFQEAIKWCEQNNKQVVRLHRTKDISSSLIKDHL